MKRVLLSALLTALPLSAASTAVFQVALGPTSAVSYRASDPIETWQAQAPVSSLTLSFDERDVTKAKLSVTLEPARFDSGNPLRDSTARRAVFDTDRYPTASFTAQRIQAAPADLPDGATRQLTCVGALTLHGVTRTVQVPVTVTRSGDALTATGSFTVQLSDYGMTRPRLLFFTVDDAVSVSFSVVGRLRS